jgi:hypothetical protein
MNKGFSLLDRFNTIVPSRTFPHRLPDNRQRREEQVLLYDNLAWQDLTPFCFFSFSDNLTITRLKFRWTITSRKYRWTRWHTIGGFIGGT